MLAKLVIAVLGTVLLLPSLAAEAPEEVGSLINGALFLYERGHKQAALKAIDHASELDPKNRRALYYREIIVGSLNYKHPTELGPRLLPVVPAGRSRKSVDL